MNKIFKYIGSALACVLAITACSPEEFTGADQNGLPQSVIEAYHEGALTVNTIANRILAHTDQMTTEQQRSHTSSERYEQSLEREHSRGIR